MLWNVCTSTRGRKEWFSVTCITILVSTNMASEPLCLSDLFPQFPFFPQKRPRCWSHAVHVSPQMPDPLPSASSRKRRELVRRFPHVSTTGKGERGEVKRGDENTMRDASHASQMLPKCCHLHARLSVSRRPTFGQCLQRLTATEGIMPVGLFFAMPAVRL
ncbi:hypothetical protein GGR56DRAFT_461426 [Xylariaceae sp. FL0804]|nr:hypothetical protein GGR56DRAFT_461426 [Xylariaceae sp. FL0804]